MTHTTHSTIGLSLRRAGALAAALTLSTLAAAAPPAGSPYATDAQNSHVFDETSQAIQQVNTVTCYMSSMRPDLMVNKGNYIALVNQTHCDPNSSASGSAASSGGSSAPSYQPVIVNSTRASGSDPMKAGVWIDQSHQGVAGTIFAALTASEAPSASNPYGTFSVEYCMSALGACIERGLLQGSSSGLIYASDSLNGGNNGDHTTTQLALTKGANDSGAGAVLLADLTASTSVTYTFAYDANFFLRSDTVSNQQACFDRSLANSQMSVWSYGLYDGNGNRVTRNSGFPISFTSNGTTYQGYAGYWGVNLQPGAPLPTTGSQVTKQNFDGSPGTTYNVVAAGGRLTKYTRQSATLATFAKVHFSLNLFAITAQTQAALVAAGAPNNNGQLNGGTMFDAYWDGSAFQIAGFMSCGQNGCVMQNLNATVPLSASANSVSDLNPMYPMSPPPLNGWSQSYGGPVSIPAATVATVLAGNPSGNVFYYSQNLVYPGAPDAPATLSCVLNCPTAADIAAYVANMNSPQATPFAAGTANAFSGTATVITYSFDVATGALKATGENADAVVPGNVQSLNGMFQNGISSGRMVASANDLASLACPANNGTYCEQNVAALPAYYVWQTGTQPWNQFVGLQSGGSYLQFDAPLSVSFAVPNQAAYGQSAGSTVVLEYDGFGQLNGIPGQCVDPATNLVVACSGPNVRWVPAFAIPFDTTIGVVTDTSSNVYYVKWLDAEVRFTKVGAGSCSQLSLGTPTLPSLSLLGDPSDVHDPSYIGPEPTFTTPPAPAVIDGVCTTAACQ